MVGHKAFPCVEIHIAIVRISILKSSSNVGQAIQVQILHRLIMPNPKH